MSYSFYITGHKNIRATHNRTIEFTKDSDLTPKGDCIVGVRASFVYTELKKFLNLKKVKITIAISNIEDSVIATPSKTFTDDHELVIRMGSFASDRTFAVLADKASEGLNKDLVALLQKGKVAKVTISEV